MQNRTADEMCDFMIDSIVNYFEDKTTDFVVFNIDEDISHKTFSINFNAYDYFIILLNYDQGIFGCSIQMGDSFLIPLQNSQEWFEEANFDVFLRELKEEIELRIPDKFLIAKGWK